MNFYDNFNILGEFTVGTSNTTISEFCATYNIKNLNQGACMFKKLGKPNLY